MGIEGTWKIKIQSPVGERDGGLEFVANGDSISGTMQGPMGSMALQDVRVDGDKASWAVETPRGVAQYNAVIDGDSITGTASFGAAGNMEFKGTRG